MIQLQILLISLCTISNEKKTNLFSQKDNYILYLSQLNSKFLFLNKSPLYSHYPCTWVGLKVRFTLDSFHYPSILRTVQDTFKNMTAAPITKKKKVRIIRISTFNGGTCWFLAKCQGLVFPPIHPSFPVSFFTILIANFVV